MTQKFDTVLVANRGEIAVRVLKSARAMGYRTVAVYSDADADALHVRTADVAVHIGAAAARESYLDPARIIDAAKRTGAGAIHPGYGFLAENSEFAKACDEAGIVFIGPPIEAIRVMGDKAVSKRLMAASGVPVLAGYQGEDQDDALLLSEADRIGFPLMVKAAAGGGGKGMRLVMTAADLPDAIAAARREALSAFGSDVLILERAVLQPRHVEIQVLGDTHGHVIALGERDCSVQRRHQKVMEEAPGPTVSPDMRAALCAAAVEAAKAVDYFGAGTVEFIVDGEEFAFLEMNTRLQVEHPVTEMVTGVDLVEWQLRIAQGERLTLAEPVPITGHAIEARLYAEDPANDYLPSTGTVLAWEPPVGAGIRVDSGITTGSVVGSDYDPMLAKIIAHGATRDEARQRLVAALQNTTILGLTTNRSFLIDVLSNETFAAGEATTKFLDDNEMDQAGVSGADVALAAAWLHRAREQDAERRNPGLGGFTTYTGGHSVQLLEISGEQHQVTLAKHGNRVTVTVGDETHHLDLHADSISVDGASVHVTGITQGLERVLLHQPHVDFEAVDVINRAKDTELAAASGVVVAPMHAAVTTVLVAVGDRVEVDQKLLTVEAMKMEMPIRADVTGVVDEIVAAGDQVSAGALLVRVTPYGDSATD